MTIVDELKIEVLSLNASLLNKRYSDEVIGISGAELLYENAMQEAYRACNSNNYPRLVNARKFMIECLTGKSQ